VIDEPTGGGSRRSASGQPAADEKAPPVGRHDLERADLPAVFAGSSAVPDHDGLGVETGFQLHEHLAAPAEHGC
jgi:hypothetical protein